jgi:hypothetical protein
MAALSCGASKWMNIDNNCSELLCLVANDTTSKTINFELLPLETLFGHQSTVTQHFCHLKSEKLFFFLTIAKVLRALNYLKMLHGQ